MQIYTICKQRYESGLTGTGSLEEYPLLFGAHPEYRAGISNRAVEGRSPSPGLFHLGEGISATRGPNAAIYAQTIFVSASCIDRGSIPGTLFLVLNFHLVRSIK